MLFIISIMATKRIGKEYIICKWRKSNNWQDRKKEKEKKEKERNIKGGVNKKLVRE